MSDTTRQTPVSAGLPLSPALDLVVEIAQVPVPRAAITTHTVQICLWALGLGVVAAFAAQLLVLLITLITNFAFFGRLSLEHLKPASAVPVLGLWVVLIPIAGAIVVGFMARYGSKAICGHGIPEAMEQVLTNESRIPARITFLKPVSAAISIGTGGPFGAEGPIIATGGALGSVLGQILHVTSAERKTLLAAGAAAGMAATFGCPIAAVLLAIELLLFEFRPRSIIPVTLAAAAAAGMRMSLEGSEPVFAIPDLLQPTVPALGCYILIGAMMGLLSIGVTRIVYAIEDAFELIPIHWMWRPALGAVVVGIVGYFAPDTLGVGYYNIEAFLSGHLAVSAVLWLCVMKFVSWSVSLGSGTSGGTLAPLLTIGGGTGAALGVLAVTLLPAAGVDVRTAALVGMAALFAGASRAMLASAVFAFETTLQPFGILPLLSGCATAYLVSGWLTQTSIMTEKIARRGIRASGDYEADLLDQVLVRTVATARVVTLQAQDSLTAACAWLQSASGDTEHQAFPVVDGDRLVGVLTRRELLARPANETETLDDCIRRPPVYVYDDCSVREAADHMVNHDVGRLPVISREHPTQLTGIITRSDILSVFRRRVNETVRQKPSLAMPPIWRTLKETTSRVNQMLAGKILRRKR